jgi:hypothetical protein
MAAQTKIKVDKMFKPIHFRDRKQVELVIGNPYFVSFGNNNVKPCILTEVEGEAAVKRISIEIPAKVQSKKGYLDSMGNISHHWVDKHSLFSDEIGLTPEEAVINEMTY